MRPQPAGVRLDDRIQQGFAQEHVSVPPCTKLDDTLADLIYEKLGPESVHRLKYFYNKHVMQKLGSQGQHAVLDIHGHLVSEADFVKCFQPRGHMDRSVMFAQFLLWKFEWKAEKKPYIIVPEGDWITLLSKLSGILKEELDGSIEGISQVFVPINHQCNSWFLLVIDIGRKCGWVLNSNERRSVFAHALGVFDEACSCLLEMGVDTSLWPLSYMRGIAVQEDNFDCGIHVLMYIDGFGRKDLYGHDKEWVFMYRQKTAVDLIYSKANRVRPKVGTAADDSSSLVISRSVPESVQGEAMPTVGSAPESVQGEAMPAVGSTPESVQGEAVPTVRSAKTESVKVEPMPTVGSALDAQGGAVSTVPEQQESTSESFSGESTSESFSGAEDTSHKRKAEVSDFEKSDAKRTRGLRSTLEVARYTKAPGNISSKMYDLVCSEKYKEYVIISIGGISITAASMAEFISGGALSSCILQAFTECLMNDEDNGARKRLFLAPQEYEKDPEKFKENIAKTLQGSVRSSLDMIFLPVLYGNEWIVYCGSGRVSNAVSFREREQCAVTRQDQRKSIMMVLQNVINETYSRKVKQKFAKRTVECLKYTEDLTTPHKNGLLALHFMECFSGDLSFELYLEGYSTAVLEYLLFHKKNTSEFPKTCSDVLEEL